MPDSTYRIGVDVGGTFTHAVALEAASLALLGKTKVPTTHTASEGVALGITQALQLLMEETGIPPSKVGFIAHSTTQATNALLEGDVAPVGILAVGRGLEGWRVRSQTRIGNISLAGEKSLPTFHAFLPADAPATEIEAALNAFVSRGARAVVAAEAFSVDDPARERAIAELARAQNLPATGTHEISGLYGLKIRTRTAALNASILPPMMSAADMTASSVQSSGIQAPLMVMRSDGGVMNIAEVRRRPLLTLLSGPAAGVAAALMFVRISDGVFLEVGGTSTDISLVTLGRARHQSAHVGGHRLFLRTLDVRTIGLGGGSMVRLKGRRPLDVGPRSAHIAGLPYCAFSLPREISGAKITLISPRPGDPEDYVILECAGKQYALTLTCAANAAGNVPAGDYAESNKESAQIAFAALAEYLQRPGEGIAVAGEVLALASRKASAAAEGLLGEYADARTALTLVGGGGGAGALLPGVGEVMHLKYRICPEAEVISAIGVALALVRETVERNIADPTPDDLLRLRQEAHAGAVRAGAAPNSITVEIEVQPLQNLARAIATGATELRERDLASREISEEERLRLAAASIGAPPEAVALAGRAGGIYAYTASIEKNTAMGLARTHTTPLRLLDAEGIVRLQLPHGLAQSARAAAAKATLLQLLDEHTAYGDAGPELPQIFLVAAGRVINLSCLASSDQVISLAQAEMDRLAADEEILIVIGC